jgi:hypothetical protein
MMSHKLFIAKLAIFTLAITSVVSTTNSRAQSNVGLTGNAFATGGNGTASAGASNTTAANYPFRSISGSSSSSFASPYAAGANTSGGAVTGDGMVGMGQAGASVFATPGGTFATSNANANNNGFGSSTAATKSDGIYSNGLGLTNASGNFATNGMSF